jgi:hypothetical protein
MPNCCISDREQLTRTNIAPDKMNADQQCLKSQLTATVGALLVQSVQFNDKLKLSGWITVSVDDGDHFSISIEQEFNSEARNNILGVNYTDEFDTHAVRNNAMNTIENFDSAFTNRHVPLSSLSQERAIKKEPTWCAMESETRENSSVPQTAQSSLFNNSFTVKLTSIWQHFTNKAKQFAAALIVLGLQATTMQVSLRPTTIQELLKQDASLF